MTNRKFAAFVPQIALATGLALAGCTASSGGSGAGGSGGASDQGTGGTSEGTGGTSEGTGGANEGGNGGALSGGSGGTTATGGAPGGSGGTAGKSTGGAPGTGGAAGRGGAMGTGGTVPLTPDPCIAANTCPAGVWVNVTPAGLKALDFGAGPIVGDPSRPSDLYMGGGGDGLWKSTDYGNTWKKINSSIGYVPMGYVMVVIPGTPAIVLVAGYKVNYRSTDGGVTFTEVPFNFPDSLYSIQIDPYDKQHLISGLHEVDGIVESNDGGVSWKYVGTGNFPSGGKSWYVFFINTGNAGTTHDTWFAIAQDGGSAVTTANAGTNWTRPTGLNGLQHSHGNAQIHQKGDLMFVAGIAGPGDGLYKSTDQGKTFTKVQSGPLSVVWGTDKNVYAMWGWACSKCDLGAKFSVAPLPAGTAFTKPAVPTALNIGANHVAVTSDGTHNIFVGMMWSQGVWRYIEP